MVHESNGQLPAYEWLLATLNPPLHAWARLARLQIERRVRGVRYRAFLEKVFHKLLLNFTLGWVNRKDPEGRTFSQGGFLRPRQHRSVRSLRSAAPPAAISNNPTALVGWPCSASICLAIALELAKEDPPTERRRQPNFFEHFIGIARAMNDVGRKASLSGMTKMDFFTTFATPQRRRTFHEDSFHGRPHSPFRRRNPRARSYRSPPRFQTPHAVVHRQSHRSPEHLESNATFPRARPPSSFSRPIARNSKRVLSRMLDESEIFFLPTACGSFRAFSTRIILTEVQVDGHISRVRL